MLQELTQFLIDHPIVMVSFGIFLLLAVIGGWYVISHHLHSVLITLLCAAGFVSGILVTYRGVQNDLDDLKIIGVFLIVIFPLVYHQVIHMAKVAYGTPAIAKGHAKRAGA
jgi:uncharacterized protein YneF (UPF0154 family)